ncbi:DedA-family integral membrane protein [Neisseria meningitidis]|uniref:DedA family protein n=1 Tax=Neisseria meningitidis TaxID=487 RepID=UPI000766C57E|nr:DedA family protein [Neisseria meningitidis]CWM12438.1 DedA-family integral membrane protein [Neisseria meningitidis]CWM86005.1 DedA-family integral membrane protein [Neisseria meningitidis]CWQ21628.1 DedA-family integral membrane protein [Neisseria meningitidis]CWQ99664.1 DedA-family integral membrane protein [Neisseria meningitidis]
MFALLEAFFVEYGYAAVFFVLVICGFGVPIPEDLTLVTGGVISGMGYTNPHIMFAVGMLGVLVGDGIMFAAGRIWGQKILKFKPIARIMTPKRYAQVQEKFDKYGNWVLFVARFLPGLRTAVFVTAGISRKVSYLRFLIMDGLAALISVPIWIYLGEYSAHNIDWLMAKMHSLQSGIFVILGIGATVVAWIWWKKRQRIQFYRSKLKEKRAQRKAAKAAKKAAQSKQ